MYGGAAVAAGIAFESAERAGDDQAQATNAAIAEQRRRDEQMRADLAPWRDAGGAAVNEQARLLGLSGEGEGFGSLNKKFTLADFWDDPLTKSSYEFGLAEGTKALDRMGGAKGNRNSGAQLKALTRFGSDYAGQKMGESYNRFYSDQDRTFNRLAGVGGTGQVSALNTAALGQQGGQNIGNLLTAQGNARGAAAIMQGSALGGAAMNSSNQWSQQATLNKMLANRNQSGGNYNANYGGQELGQQDFSQGYY